MQAHREIETLTQALSTGRGDARQWGRLGSLQAQRGDWAASADAFERAIQLAPDELAAYQGLARARLALQDLNGSRRLAGELETRFPDAAFTHLLSGHLHKAFGDVDAARRAYLRALEREPTLGEALYGIVDISVPSPEDAIALQAAELAARDDLPVADRINAGFSIARILDGSGKYSEAFRHYEQANIMARDDLARRGIVYDPALMEERVENRIRSFPAGSFRSTLPPLPVDLTPIFIVGMPRSGTTLLEQILASHPEVQAGGELPVAHECEARFRSSRRRAGGEGPVDPADKQDAALLEEARERYIEALFEQDLEGPWVVDKMPANFEIAGFLRQMFPQALIIHSMRDARATGFSLYTANFAGHEPYYHTLEHLAHYHSQYQQLMEHWRTVIPEPFIEIAYEELVDDPASRIPALLEQAGLQPHPDCLEFHRNRRPILTASHGQVRRPVYRSALEHWRHYEPWLGPLLKL